MFLGDVGLKNLEQIIIDWDNISIEEQNPNEARTRFALIDRILTEVFSWPKNAIEVETNINGDYSDYILKTHRKMLVLEAKKFGVSFTLPKNFSKRHLKISGSLWTEPAIKSAIEQVQNYCNNSGVPFAVATNGNQWILFEAINASQPWKDGRCIIIKSLQDLKENFTELWNIFSYDAVRNGSLADSFNEKSGILPTYRILDHLKNSNESVVRNSLHLQIRPLISQIFEDITSNPEVLEQCYIIERSEIATTDGLSLAIKDSVPLIAKNDSTIEVNDKKNQKAGGYFGVKIREIVKDTPTFSTVLLMGGVGAGKTTFLKRYFEVAEKKYIDDFCTWFYINFLRPPTIEKFEDFIYSNIFEQIKNNYSHFNSQKWDSLIEIFKDEIAEQKEGILFGLSDEIVDGKIRELISNWKSDKAFYSKKLLQWVRKRKGKSVVLVIDNIDQLDFDYQQKIFLFAHHIAKESESIVIVSLREETYFSSNKTGVFSAYHNLRYHLPAPSFDKVMSARLKYGQDLLKKPAEEIKRFLKTQNEINYDDLAIFFNIVSHSLFSQNQNILRCIKALSGGNTREALDMGNTFMTSGYADVNKMIRIRKEEGRYTIAFHEFVKAIVLGDRRFYSEKTSRIKNIFELNDPRGSHFTSLRIINYLIINEGAPSKYGKGFIAVSEVVKNITELFSSENDVIGSIKKLLLAKLIETENHQLDLNNSFYIRATPAGEFYTNYFCKSFIYLDLVLIDTPLRDLNIFEQIKEVAETQNVEERLKRTSLFLDYLSKQEETELANIPQSQREIYALVPQIRKQVEGNEFPVIKQSAANTAKLKSQQPPLPETGNE